ncbi:MAG: hypothetical protein M1834_009311 [Cirrosporium novae-zelandiae]|nr:MAG: hypothetical protein M1834_009311 [Cirrosporium novae-zelandiae]
MARDKDRAVNPAQAQRKAEKQKALKKSKTEQQARRTEKLAHRNPERLQRQIDDLKAIESSGRPLRPHEKKVLEELERDIKAVRKARETLGDKAPSFGRERSEGHSQHGRFDQDGILGKRRRQQNYEGSSGSETDESVRKIPMPRDTPPPIPKEHLWRNRQDSRNTPEGRHPLPTKPEIKPQTVYESAPVVRNLRQEAVSAFVPAAVRRKQEVLKGEGKLVEPEEMDKLEKEGYTGSGVQAVAPPKDGSAISHDTQPLQNSLEEEEAKFERELKQVQMEEVDDEDL